MPENDRRGPMHLVGVAFVPLATDKKNPNVGPGSLGKTDAEGRFTLQTVNGESGAVPTEHVVRMAMALAPGGDSPMYHRFRRTAPGPSRRLSRTWIPCGAAWLGAAPMAG
jgi:hypothetical protein